MDSRNRDDLANERTFLAYLRTSLAFIAFGFVVARFSLFVREITAVTHMPLGSSHISVVFGTVMAAVGVVVGLYGTGRYVAMMAAIDSRGTAPMPPWAAVTGGVVVAVIGVAVAVALFTVH